MNATQAQNNFTMKPIDQRERTRGRNDILTRRMKNRERQRRYRARKRLEAESNSSSIIRPSTIPEINVEVKGTISNHTPRVYCNRKWKKDARRAHLSKDSEVQANACAAPTSMSTSESRSMFLSGMKSDSVSGAGTCSEVAVDKNSSEMFRPKLGRRDWKADARKQKN